MTSPFLSRLNIKSDPSSDGAGRHDHTVPGEYLPTPHVTVAYVFKKAEADIKPPG